jgi:hypothetical protein
MGQLFTALEKLLSAAPTLLSGKLSSRQPNPGQRPKRWSAALHALYDEVLSEPVPRRLVEMLRRLERSRKG